MIYMTSNLRMCRHSQVLQTISSNGLKKMEEEHLPLRKIQKFVPNLTWLAMPYISVTILKQLPRITFLTCLNLYSSFSFFYFCKFLHSCSCMMMRRKFHFLNSHHLIFCFP